MDGVSQERTRNPVGDPDAPPTVTQLDTADLTELKRQGICQENREENRNEEHDDGFRRSPEGHVRVW
jgi:hypothetical protein